MGTLINNVDIVIIKSELSELLLSKDQEHNIMMLSNDFEMCLEIYKNTLLLVDRKKPDVNKENVLLDIKTQTGSVLNVIEQVVIFLKENDVNGLIKILSALPKLDV
jgi:hypothetical protein